MTARTKQSSRNPISRCLRLRAHFWFFFQKRREEQSVGLHGGVCHSGGTAAEQTRASAGWVRCEGWRESGWLVRRRVASWSVRSAGIRGCRASARNQEFRAPQQSTSHAVYASICELAHTKQSSRNPISRCLRLRAYFWFLFQKRREEQSVGLHGEVCHSGGTVAEQARASAGWALRSETGFPGHCATIVVALFGTPWSMSPPSP